MTHDGQNPSAKISPLAEEMAKAQSSLAGVLRQIHGLFPITSEPVGVADGEPGAELPNRHQRSFLAASLVVQSTPAEAARIETEAATGMR